MGAELDKDNFLKERFGRVLYATGHVVRFNIQVLREAIDGGKTAKEQSQLTDVDVLGARVPLLGQRRVVIGDCKSGKDGSPSERLYWLSGLRNRLGADEAFFVKSELEPTPFLGEYRRLGLEVLSSQTLTTLETRTDANNLATASPVADGSVGVWDRELSKVKDVDKRYFRFLTAGAWLHPLGARIESLFTLLPALQQKHLGFARRSSMALLAHAILELTHRASGATKNNRRRQVLTELAGQTSVAAQERVVIAAQQFLKAEIRELTGKEWPVGRETMTSFLEPPFLDDIVELVDRWSEAGGASLVPQFLDQTAFVDVGLMPRPSFRHLHLSGNLAEAVSHATGSFAAFMERSKLVQREERDAIIRHGEATEWADAKRPPVTAQPAATKVIQKPLPLGRDEIR